MFFDARIKIICCAGAIKKKSSASYQFI